MNAKDTIKSFLNGLSSDYKDIFEKFRYEYNPSLETHLIEVAPARLYDNISYGEKELTFSIDFMNSFGENILFVSLDSNIVKIETPEFEISNNKVELDNMFALNNEASNDLPSEYVYKYPLDEFEIQDYIKKCNHCEFGYNDYALAA